MGVARVMGVAVLVKVGFVAVAFAVASITALQDLQEPRGLTAWERRTTVCSVFF